MTTNQLISELKDLDEDVLDAEIIVLVQRKLDENTVISMKCQLKKVLNDIDPKTGGLVLRVE